MKKGFFVVLLIPVLLASCLLFGPDNRYWNGRLDGTEGLYDLEIAQEGRNLVFTVSVNRAEYDKLAADGFTPPPELFVWMSPTHAENGAWNDSGHKHFWPVARKRVGTDFYTDADATVDITVNLERIANDWNMRWLSPEHFNGDPDDWWEHNWDNPNRPDMTGVYAIVADNYLKDDNYHYDYHSGSHDDVYQYYGNWDTTTLQTPSGQERFLFRNSRPYGHGYSSVGELIGEDWTPILIVPPGMKISTSDVYGGIEFQIQLNVNLAEYPDEVAVRLPIAHWNHYTLNAANATPDSNTADGEFLWRIVYERQDYGAVQVLDDVIHAPGPNRDSWHDIRDEQYWFGAWFGYYGYADVLFSTAFDSEFFDNATPLDGWVGGELTRTVESPHPWDGWTTVVNADNNWNIAAFETLWFSPMLGVAGNVLGLGAGGVIANPYGAYRNDVVEFPPFNYFDHLDSVGAWDIVVSFDFYKDLGYSWNDTLYLERGRYESSWDGWSWHVIGSWTGPQDHWENQGWRRETVRVDKWLFQYWDDDTSSYVGDDTVIRFRFESRDAWNAGNGAFIDNLSVLVLE